ncbi:MAG: thiamine phosphate synthase [Polyangia bacterium]|jgi:thiamine-phosphate pyrophosphorylase|nr:thiamine phosphate synthase [Polyangia bacterium]
MAPDETKPFARGLYAILDLASLGPRDPHEVAVALLGGGAVALQLRAKGQTDALDPLGRLALAIDLRRLARSRGVPFFVNDDLDLALASEADGVHLGQGDLHPGLARSRLSKRQRIGLSTHNLGQARAALSLPVDYLGFGPVFPTGTKANPDPAQGLAALHEVCRSVALPVVAIGGLTTTAAGEVARAGAHAAAAIGAILGAQDPGTEARRFHEAFQRAAPGIAAP